MQSVCTWCCCVIHTLRDFLTHGVLPEKMDFNGLRLEYALEGTSNSISWNDHMEELLDDSGLIEYVKKNIPRPPTVDVQVLA